MAEHIKCPKCGIELTNRNRLIKENCGHSKCRQCLISEEIGCEECKQVVKNANKVKIHIIDNKCLSADDTIVHRLKRSSNERTLFPPHIVKELFDDKLVYRCTICEKRFSSRTQQYYHLFCNNSSNKPHKCEHCSKTFSTASHLKYHMDGHSQKSFSCSVCCKTFTKLQIMRKHEKLHIAVAQECTECGIKIKNKVAFNAHMQKHQNIFPFSCNVCEKRFSLKSSLRMHENVHTGIKLFKCDQCEKKFDRNSTLKLHILRHSKQKKYSCQECLKQFIDSKSLLRHSKIHIANAMYKCSLCDTTSIRKDNITRHMRNMHPNDKDTNCIEIIPEDIADSMSDDLKQSCVDAVPLHNLIEGNSYTTEESKNDVPKTVANSSVIKCIGNVQPVIIPIENQVVGNAETKQMETAHAIHSSATAHKKLKKKYDPCEIYRKILLDDDSIQENDTSGISDTLIPSNNESTVAQEASVSYSNGQQSNFSETHWRKNFKHNYQIQFD